MATVLTGLRETTQTIGSNTNFVLSQTGVINVFQSQNSSLVDAILFTGGNGLTIINGTVIASINSAAGVYDNTPNDNEVVINPTGSISSLGTSGDGLLFLTTKAKVTVSGSVYARDFGLLHNNAAANSTTEFYISATGTVQGNSDFGETSGFSAAVASFAREFTEVPIVS